MYQPEQFAQVNCATIFNTMVRWETLALRFSYGWSIGTSSYPYTQPPTAKRQDIHPTTPLKDCSSNRTKWLGPTSRSVGCAGTNCLSEPHHAAHGTQGIFCQLLVPDTTGHSLRACVNAPRVRAISLTQA